MPIDDFINQSTIDAQIEEKYERCYDPQIAEKVNELVYESTDIHDALMDELDCCVDFPEFDQVDDFKIIDMEHHYEPGSDEVYMRVSMYFDISFEAKNHTAGEDWSPGSGTVSFEAVAVGTIPIIWGSEDTDRLVLDDSILINDIEEFEVIR